MQKTLSAPNLKLLHEVLPYGPHSRPFAVNVHWYGSRQTSQLDASDGQKDVFGAVGL